MPCLLVASRMRELSCVSVYFCRLAVESGGGARLVPDRFLVGCVRLCGDGLIYGGGDGDDIGDVVCGYVVVGDGVGFVGSY